MRQQLNLASAVLAASAILVSTDCAAQQHRQINAASSHVVLSAPASVGGPKGTHSSAGPRFPLIPAGALNAAPVSVHRPVAKPGPPTIAGGVRTGGPPHPAAAAGPVAITPPAAAAHGNTTAASAPGASAAGHGGSANAAPASVNPSAPAPRE